jgi:hypothetical protein
MSSSLTTNSPEPTIIKRLGPILGDKPAPHFRALSLSGNQIFCMTLAEQRYCLRVAGRDRFISNTAEFLNTVNAHRSALAPAAVWTDHQGLQILEWVE